MRPGMLTMSSRVYPTSVFSIQGPVMARVRAIAISFGMKESVISLIEVAAWNAPMTTPVMSAARSSGAARASAISRARLPMLMMVSGVMLRLGSVIEALGERAHDQRPAVDEHEEHELEGQGDEHGRDHHHAHGHQHARHHEIDDHERNEEEESDEECGLELARHERRNEYAERDVERRCVALAAGDVHESGDVALAGLMEHELLQRR